jgi:hypothetical protein
MKGGQFKMVKHLSENIVTYWFLNVKENPRHVGYYINLIKHAGGVGLKWSNICQKS